jgi:hypothetical protein
MLRPIRLAVMFDQQVHAGGGYQQALNAALLVRSLPKDLVFPVYYTTFRENLETLSNFGLDAHLVELNKVSRVWLRLRASFGNYFTLKFFKFFQNINSFETIFLKENIDLVYF